MTVRLTPPRALFHGLIDYAGLFPPASLDMAAAVRNYSSYRAGEEDWMLCRFVVPAARLAEFSTAFNETCCNEQMTPWLLSVLSSGDSEEDARQVEAFSEGAAFLDAMEFNASDPAQVETQLRTVPSGMAAFVEFPPEQAGEVLPILKRFNASAKIRTGGITPDAIPSSRKIARFLVECARERVPFKATAGLHHPLRAEHKLTYENDGPSATMHGFVNVFVAAVVAYFGAAEEELIALLDEASPAAFQWKKTSLQWRNRKLTPRQIKEVREQFALGFGSCSFTEPVQELKALGWL